MTRFNITLNEGAEFVLFCLSKMLGGEIFVPKIQSYKIMDVVKAISNKPKLKFVGIRPGEKLHEEMVSKSDAVNTISFKNYYVISPNSKFIGWDKKKYLKLNKLGKSCVSGFSYTSENNNKFLSVKELKKLIELNIKK